MILLLTGNLQIGPKIYFELFARHKYLYIPHYGNNLLINKVKEIGIFSIGISNATLAELYFGAYNSKYTKKNLRNISAFKRNLTIYSDSSGSAELFGKAKAELKASGCMIEDFDILIASIAMANNCILVTNNVHHFERIDAIQLENWLEK